MLRGSRHVVLTIVACAVLLPATSAGAVQTATFTPGAQMISQPPGQPWTLKVLLDAQLGSDDGSLPSPVRHMRISFPAGAGVNLGAFRSCSKGQVTAARCPAAARIGTGSALADLAGTPIDATVTVYNGPRTGARQTAWIRVVALTTIPFVFTATIRKTTGRFGHVMDLDIPPVLDTMQPGGVPITRLTTTLGGYGRSHGRRVPLVTAPTRCSGGWRFQAAFRYADGSTITRKSQISCTLMATPVA